MSKTTQDNPQEQTAPTNTASDTVSNTSKRAPRATKSTSSGTEKATSSTAT